MLGRQAEVTVAGWQLAVQPTPVRWLRLGRQPAQMTCEGKSKKPTFMPLPKGRLFPPNRKRAVRPLAGRLCGGALGSFGKVELDFPVRQFEPGLERLSGLGLKALENRRVPISQ